MTKRVKKEFEEVKPDMTPMIDVTFLLLIFFIVTLKFKTLEGRLDSNLPKDMGTSTQETPPVEKVDIVIRVGNPGLKQPDPATRTKSKPLGRLDHFRGRILKVSIGTSVYTVRNDAHDEKGLLADLDKLRRKLQDFDKEETPITLDAREGIIYEDVIGILDLVIDEGFQKVSFAGSQEQG